MAKRDGTCCFKCRFFQLQSTPGEDGLPEDAFGICRRHAPQVQSLFASCDTENELEYHAPVAYWPEVSGIDWCGEFA